jgi:hypothetical protein
MSTNVNTEPIIDGPTVPPDRFSFGEGVERISEVLKGLSGRDRLRALRAVAGEYGHRVMPGLGTYTNNPASSRVARVGGRPVAPQQPRSTKSAKQKQIDSEIKELNSKIKEKSAAQGGPLPKEDPLLERRQRLFRAKHEREAGPLAPHSGASGSHP